MRTFYWINHGPAGGRNNPQDAQDVGELLEDIGGQAGQEPTADVIGQFVDRSRPEGAPTHKFFEWNDVKAGELYRRRQARDLISRISIEVVVDEQVRRKQRFMESLSETRTKQDSEEESKTRRWCTYDQIIADPEKAAQLLRQALNELITFKNKWERYREVYQEFAALDKITHEIDHLYLKLNSRPGKIEGSDERESLNEAAG